MEPISTDFLYDDGFVSILKWSTWSKNGLKEGNRYIMLYNLKNIHFLQIPKNDKSHTEFGFWFRGYKSKKAETTFYQSFQLSKVCSENEIWTRDLRVMNPVL